MLRDDKKTLLIDTNCSVAETMDLMNRNKVKSLIIIDAGKLVGVVTQGDICRHIISGGALLTEVSDCMQLNPIFVSSNHKTLEIKKLFREQLITHIPVCDQAMQVVDIISVWDYL